MILKGLKRRSNQIFLKKNVDSFIKNSLKKAPEKINKILIMTDKIGREDVLVQRLCATFDLNESQIEVVVFQRKKEKNNITTQIITEKNFGWHGKIKDAYLKSILTNKYDLLINYSKVENLYSDLLILQVQSDLKVGLASLNNEYYDLLIQCSPSDTALFTNELKKYLEILK